MKYLIVLLTVFLMSSAYAECDRYNKFLDVSTNSIAFVLNCKSYTNIRHDLDKLGKRMGLCPNEKGPVCLYVGKASVMLIKKQIPQYWLCKPDIAMAVVEKAVVKACEYSTGW